MPDPLPTAPAITAAELRRPRLHRPGSVKATAAAMGLVLLGYALWLVLFLEDSDRFAADSARVNELGIHGHVEDGPFGSNYAMAFGGFTVASIALAVAAVRLWRHGGRPALVTAGIVLGLTAACCAVPTALTEVLSTVSRPEATGDVSGMTFDEAISVVHEASTPRWVAILVPVTAALLMVGSIGGLAALLRPASRAFARQPTAG